MKCIKCGTEFDEGVFCPECGHRYDEEEIARVENEKKEREAKEKAEQERMFREQQEREERRKAEEERKTRELEEQRKAEEERKARELEERRKAEEERKAKEQEERRKAEEERKARELEEQQKAEEERRIAKQKEEEKLRKEKEELDLRTFNGKVYANKEEADIAKTELNQVEELKQRLLSTKKQEERRKIIVEFGDAPKTEESRARYDALKAKSEQEKPKSIMIKRIYGITVLVAFILALVIPVQTGPVYSALFIWAGCGIWIWLIWSIVLLVKSKSRSYYLNIKDI